MSAQASDDAVERIEALLPAGVREICQTLTAAGHQAVTVGGAVRDAMLGLMPGDWDVATSAAPEQVVRLFPRTIPTGLQHGTVTVVVGRGSQRLAVEVTTFRGEGTYSDGRRPDEVVFGVPLKEDLARRDFVINAIAYDPVQRKTWDPFGGVADLHARRIRAVGAPVQRLCEDGLRVMRAMRFAAVLEFDLDAETEAAIEGALPSLAKVSRERVRDELVKLLGARTPSLGLQIARRTKIFDTVLPAIGSQGRDDEQWRHIVARTDAVRGLNNRLVSLLLPGNAPIGQRPWADEAAGKSVGERGRELILSNADSRSIVALARFAGACRGARGGAGEIRRIFAAVGRSLAPDLLALWTAEAAALGSDSVEGAEILRWCQCGSDILAAGDALLTAELALSGTDVLRLLEARPGPVVGTVLAELLEAVLDDPTGNEKRELTARVLRWKQLHAAR